MDLRDLPGIDALLGEHTGTRAIRLRLGQASGELLNPLLLPQRIDITEAVCEGIQAEVTCLATRADLPLREFVGLPVEIGIVTDVGELRRICAIVTACRQGQSDGALTVIHLSARDALGVMEQRRSNRVFLEQTVLEVLSRVFDGWRERPELAACFAYASHCGRPYARRAFTLQCNESDATFVRRLMRRHGIVWVFRPGPAGARVPSHELVLIDRSSLLDENCGGELRYHRRDGTEQRDTIGLLTPEHRLVVGSVVRSSADHELAYPQEARWRPQADQGNAGNALAQALRDARIDPPHAGDSEPDYEWLTELDAQRHAQHAATLHGVSNVRSLAAGEWNAIAGHPQLDARKPWEREYLMVSVHHWGANNLPKSLDRHRDLLAGRLEPPEWARTEAEGTRAAQRYANRFVAVRRDTPVVPAWDPAVHLPRLPRMTGTVAGPAGEAVHCDELGRVKVCIDGLDRADQGLGPPRDRVDTAWVRVDVGWAGDGYGAIFPLRAGMEVHIDFVGGDPDRPVIVAAHYNSRSDPPRFEQAPGLPGNRYLGGIVTREVGGWRQQQLRFDDTPGELSTQLGSDAATSELNLGELHTPRQHGRAEPRGRGAELRSDAPVAVRGGGGVYVTADAQKQAAGGMLDRKPLLGLIQALRDLEAYLGDEAKRHLAGDTATDRIERLAERLEGWHDAGAGVVAINAPEGIAVASQDDLVLGAQSHLEGVSIGNLQLSAGRRLLLRCAEALSAYAAQGMRLVAAQGALQAQAHDGDIELTATQRIVLTAGSEIVLQAPQVRLVAQGAQVQLGSGGIVEQCSGGYVVESASVSFDSPGDGAPPGVALPAGRTPHDQRVLMRWVGTDEPMRSQRYRVTTESGRVFEGRTDADGLTERFPSDIAFGSFLIVPLDDPPSG